MNHNCLVGYEKMPPCGGTSQINLFAFLFVFALLISNTAAGLASRLAGGLAFAATAVFSAFAKVTSFDSFDMFHNNILQIIYLT